MKKERLLNAIGEIDDKLILDAKPEVKVKQRRIKHQWVAALAACFILALCFGVAIPLTAGNSEAGTVTMEINPGVEYVVTRNGKVNSARFLNEDAKDALEEVSFKGQSLKTAVTLTVAAYKASGFMDRNDTVLISFDSKLSKNAKLKESVSLEICKVLEETTVRTVVYVSATDSAETDELAEKYNISQGKAKFIADAAKNSDLSVDELVKLPLDELVDLQETLDSQIISAKYIGMTKAKAIALADAGCETRVRFTETILITVGVNSPYYRLVFDDTATQWTYHVKATDGEILEKSKAELFISLEKARAIALADAKTVEGDPETKVVFTKEELNRSQNRPCWVFEFYTARYLYGYKIDARTSEIVYLDYRIHIEKAREIALLDAGCGDKVDFTSEEYVGGGIKTPYYRFVFNNAKTQWTYRIDATLGIVLEKNAESLFIPLDEAKKTALSDAEISDATEAVFTKEELSRNQGQPCWILEFHTEKYSFCYKIDAKTGDILFSRRYISLSRAKEVALVDAGCTETKPVFTVEELVDGGIKTPYYMLEFNCEMMRWTYRIDALSGAVMHRSKEDMTVTLQKAKEIALLNAGVPENVPVVFTKEILSRNQGQPCWILEFHTEKYSFCYKIDAKTSEILFSRKYIDISFAKEVALRDCGFTTSDKVVFVTEELIESGVKVPYYYLVLTADDVRYTYHVSATDGEILFKAKDFVRVTG